MPRASTPAYQRKSSTPLPAWLAKSLSLTRFGREDEVVEMANDTEYGPASYVHTNDLNRSWRMMEALEIGNVDQTLGEA